MNPLSASEAAHHGIVSRLQDLALETGDAEEFFKELAVFSAALLGPPGVDIFCNVSVARRKKPVAIAGSTPQAKVMDQLQYAFGDGPCLAAMRTKSTVHVPDVSTERRWPEYLQAVAAHGVGSILGVPLLLEGDSSGSLNIYSSQAHGFSPEDIAKAELFAVQTAKTLRLELRLAQLRDARHDLAAAMQSRTIIDMAVGAIMAQNRCSQEAAITILRKASGARNIKLRDVAAGVIGSISPGSEIITYFDE